jgi:glycerol kinase
MVKNNFLMQFMADILGVPVIRPAVTETTAIGAGYAAGLAVGFWKDLSEIRSTWRQDKLWHPNMDKTTRLNTLHFWHKAIDKSMNWTN